MSAEPSQLRLLFLTALIALFIAGCMLTIDPIEGIIDGGDGTGGDTSNQITIRVINATNVTLDPEIYVSAEPVSVEQLFQSANKFTAYGVGTTGILADFDSDTFALDCSQVRVIGTRGGRFGDDLSNPEATGQQVVLTQDLNVFCDGSVTFTYTRSAGEYTTTFVVAR